MGKENIPIFLVELIQMACLVFIATKMFYEKKS